MELLATKVIDKGGFKNWDLKNIKYKYKKTSLKLLAKFYFVNETMIYFNRLLAWFKTFSTVKPNLANSCSAGPDSPKVVMPMILPFKPTYLNQ